MNNRLVVGISGATGAIYGIELLRQLKKLPVESHLIISKAAALTITAETDMRLEEVKSLADYNYTPSDISASLSSGSFKTMGMIIAPCSIKTMSAIATGNTVNLLTRAADVTLKEQRKLVLMVRETPLHLGHLRTMTHLAEMGAIIAPPVPAFYHRPTTLLEVVHHSISRVIDLFSLPNPLSKEWQGLPTLK